MTKLLLDKDRETASRPEFGLPLWVKAREERGRSGPARRSELLCWRSRKGARLIVFADVADHIHQRRQ